MSTINNLFEKIKKFFITTLSIILVGIIFFVISIVSTIILWFVYLFFSLITLFGIINE